mmetsp:Transcript_4439/g.18928  ORF Transcript_4439/g.18928 Transcript_4439/m.18928 type:complete len:217 (+) Transcript_4439:1307-1957(+)
MPFKTPSVDQVRPGGTAPGTARSGARAFSTLRRAWSSVRGFRSRRVSGGAPTSTVITSRSNVPFRSGLLNRSASSSRGSTLRRKLASHARTSSSRSADGGGAGRGPSRYSNTTGTAPASAAVSAARRAKDATRECSVSFAFGCFARGGSTSIKSARSAHFGAADENVSPRRAVPFSEAAASRGDGDVVRVLSARVAESRSRVSDRERRRAFSLGET